MKFIDRLCRLLARYPESLKTEAVRPQDQSQHTAASDIEIHAAADGASRLKWASGPSEKDFVLPQSATLDAPHNSSRSERTISTGVAPSINSELAGSVARECHSLVTNNPRSADKPRPVKANSEANAEMSERPSWQATGHDASEFAANLTPSLLDADTPAGATSGYDDRIELDSEEPAPSLQKPEAAEKTAVSLIRIECPRCRAIYEVGRELIAMDGRDVQCSNCGHEWYHPSEACATMGSSQSSPSAPEQHRVHHSASHDSSELGLHGEIAPIERADCLPLTPSEVRLVISGQLEALSDFTASGRLHAVDPKGDSPLHLAARIGKLALCNLLVRAGANPLALNHSRQTSADVALAEGHTLVAQLLYSLSAISAGTKSIEDQAIRPLPDPSIKTADPKHLPGTDSINASESIHGPRGPVPPMGTYVIEQLRAEPFRDDKPEAVADTSQEASAADSVTHSNANVEKPNSDGLQISIRAEMDSLDELMKFDAEEEPEAFFGQSVRSKASGTFIPLGSSAPSAPDGENGDWKLDLSAAQIAGDGIGSNGLLSQVKGDEHDFLKVRSRGPKSTKKAVIQTGTQLSIDPDFCLAWAEEILAKGWCSGDDLDQLIDSCEGNGDPDELCINLERSLEIAGLMHDGENPEEAGLWGAKSDVSADDLADIIEVTLTRATRLPGTQRFRMDKSDEQQLLEPMMRAKQELLLGLLAWKAAVEAILETVDKIADGSRDPGSFSLRTIIPARPGHSETSEVMAASEALKSWHISGHVLDGKRRREALAALDALDLSLAYQKNLVAALTASEANLDQAVRLNGLIAAYEAANQRLILEHLPYARRFAARNVEPNEDPEDVFQVAFLGLQRSTRRFDPERGVRFVIYCAFWMKQAITRWRADEGSPIRVPVHRHEDLSKLEAALDRLDTRGDGTVSDDDLAIELEWTVDQVRQFRRVPRKGEYPDDTDAWDALVPEPENEVSSDQLETEKIVNWLIGSLEERDADVIRRRFGIGRYEEMTLEEIGQLYGVTRERIRQIEARALRFLCHPARYRRLQILLGM